MKNLSRFFAVFLATVLMSCGNEKKEQETITIGDGGNLETGRPPKMQLLMIQPRPMMLYSGRMERYRLTSPVMI